MKCFLWVHDTNFASSASNVENPFIPTSVDQKPCAAPDTNSISLCFSRTAVLPRRCRCECPVGVRVPLRWRDAAGGRLGRGCGRDAAPGGAPTASGSGGSASRRGVGREAEEMRFKWNLKMISDIQQHPFRKAQEENAPGLRDLVFSRGLRSGDAGELFDARPAQQLG